jgi:hypothetical protein
MNLARQVSPCGQLRVKPFKDVTVAGVVAPFEM